MEVVGVTNDAGEDVRNGVVSSGENVTVETVFYPAFLREDYSLDLHLFMVCKGAELADNTRVRPCPDYVPPYLNISLF